MKIQRGNVPRELVVVLGFGMKNVPKKVVIVYAAQGIASRVAEKLNSV